MGTTLCVGVRMPGRRGRPLALAVCLTLGSLVPVGAQQTTTQFEISGTSTVRGWTCPVEGVTTFSPGGSSGPAPGFPNGLAAVSITVQVREIECPEEQMREHLQEAMDAPAHPEIVFALERYTVDGDTARVMGAVTIHGVTRPVTLDVELVEEGGALRGVGAVELNMTEFGVTPPALWGGLLSVGELIEVAFEVPLGS